MITFTCGMDITSVPVQFDRSRLFQATSAFVLKAISMMTYDQICLLYMMASNPSGNPELSMFYLSDICETGM